MEYFIGKLETAHYSFMCLGNSEDEVRKAMEEGWNIHRRQTKAAPWKEFVEDLMVLKIPLGLVSAKDVEYARRDRHGKL